MYINPNTCSDDELTEILKIEEFLNNGGVNGVELQDLKLFLTPLKIGKYFYEHIIANSFSIYGFTLISKMQASKTIPVFSYSKVDVLAELSDKYKFLVKDDRYITDVDNIIYNIINFEKSIIDFFEKANKINLLKSRRFSILVMPEIIKIDLDNNLEHKFMDYSLEEIIKMNSFFEYLINNNICGEDINLVRQYNKSLSSVVELFKSFNPSQKTISERYFRKLYVAFRDLHIMLSK